jgi:integrase
MTRDGASPATVSNVMRTLSAAVGEAAREGLIPANPMIGLQRPKVHRTPREALSPLQAETLRAELPTLRDRCLWGLMCAAGLRPEEALALRWSNVLELELTGGTLSIERVYSAGEIRETTKTGKFRDVPIVPTLAADLIALHELAPLDPDALVIATGTGTPTGQPGQLAQPLQHRCITTPKKRPRNLGPSGCQHVGQRL